MFLANFQQAKSILLMGGCAEILLKNISFCYNLVKPEYGNLSNFVFAEAAGITKGYR